MIILTAQRAKILGVFGKSPYDAFSQRDEKVSFTLDTDDQHQKVLAVYKRLTTDKLL